MYKIICGLEEGRNIQGACCGPAWRGLVAALTRSRLLQGSCSQDSAERWAKVWCSHQKTHFVKDAIDTVQTQEAWKELETDSSERSKTMGYITASKCSWQVECIYQVLKKLFGK